jgi:soluble lytic murein transglycosylase
VLARCAAHSNTSTGPSVAEADAPEMFDPNVARPTPGSPLALVRTALGAGDLAGARALAQTALATPPDDASSAELRFVLARVELTLGDRAAAERLLAEVGESTHALAPWARLRRAELLEASDSAEALRVATPLAADGGTGAPHWAGQARARAVEARSLLRAGRADEALPRLRALVLEARAALGAASVALPLADALALRADPASKEEALALYRRVASRAPLADQGRAADAKATALLATLAEDRRLALAEPTLDDALARADALYESSRNEAAEQSYAAVAARFTAAGDAARSCTARLQQARALDRRRARAEAVTLFVAVADECSDPDTKALARYGAGRALHNLARHDEAIAQFEALERDAPTHRLADDALLRAAIVAREHADDAGFAERLTVLPARYPLGDMRGEARFLSAWRLRALGKPEDALAELDRSLAEGPSETGEDVHGRAAYWRARLFDELGRTADAVRAHEALCLAAPLAYYAQLSLVQLARLEPARADAVRAAWLGEAREVPLLFPRRPELDAPAFARAVALLRTGDVDLAQLELAALGATGEGADPDALWLAAALLDRAGAYGSSMALLRKRLPNRLDMAPTGRARALWRLAYPHAYAPVIDDAATAEGIPASLVRAIAREESAFDPEAHSAVGASGLIQLMSGTARRFAGPLGLPSDAAALRRPEVNVRIGSSFLGFLVRRYPGRPGLVPGAYNAGEGAMDRWQRARSAEPLDVFVENVPYDESRRYTRRVLQTWGTYALLDERTLPRFSE